MALVVTPTVVDQRGGTALVISGEVFLTGVAYTVHMGPLGNASDPQCYGGPGNGYHCYRSEDGTLVAVTPPVESGSASAQQISISGFGSVSISIIESAWHSAVFNIRRNFPPLAGAGARRLELEARRSLQ